MALRTTVVARAAARRPPRLSHGYRATASSLSSTMMPDHRTAPCDPWRHCWVHSTPAHPKQGLEGEFYVAAALMVSAVAGFPEGQAEALRLQLPQLLWKVRPVNCFVSGGAYLRCVLTGS